MRPLLRFLHYPYLLWGHCGRGYLAGRKIFIIFFGPTTTLTVTVGLPVAS